MRSRWRKKIKVWKESEISEVLDKLKYICNSFLLLSLTTLPFSWNTLNQLNYVLQRALLYVSFMVLYVFYVLLISCLTCCMCAFKLEYYWQIVLLLLWIWMNPFLLISTPPPPHQPTLPPQLPRIGNFEGLRCSAYLKVVPEFLIYSLIFSITTSYFHCFVTCY